LANDALESAAPEGIVERHGDGDGCPLHLQLHDSVTAALAHGDKSVPFENLTGFCAERTLNLPNRHLNLSDEDLTVQPPCNFGRSGGLEKERQGFDEIGARLLDCGTLACDIELGAQGDKAIVFALNNSRHSLRSRHIRILRPTVSTQFRSSGRSC